MIDVYVSGIDEAGRFGAVLERDDDTAYFYLLDMREQEGRQIISAFNAGPLTQMPADIPVSIRWSVSNAAVGLFVAGALSVVFELGVAAIVDRQGMEEIPCDRKLESRHRIRLPRTRLSISQDASHAPL